MADPFDFPGGLSQTDWFQLGSNAAMTGGAQAAYNQAGYYACATMRQQQKYQEKNYHLSWAQVARDDVRGVMQASSNRLANYVLVGTLILQTAISMYLNDGLSKGTPTFVFAAFWTSTALSVLFFTTSVALAVKGQNTAFLATTRLLCWEIRPENPAAYDFDYMQQINKFESMGMKEVFRLPGWATRWHGEERIPEENEVHPDLSGKDAPSLRSKAADPSTNFTNPRPLDPFCGMGHQKEVEQDESQKYEELHPETKELLYLARYGRYMQLWQTYDTHSKYCIGLGLICMSQGASFWCLGRLASSEDHRIIQDIIGGIMMAILTSVSVLTCKQSFHKKRVGFAAWLVFGAGPVLGYAAVYLQDPAWIQKVLRPLFMLTYSWKFIIGYFWSFTERHRDAVEKYITGPNGQTFETMDDAPRSHVSHHPLHGMHEGPEGSHFDKSEWNSTVDGYTDFADSDTDDDSDDGSEFTYPGRREKTQEEVLAEKNDKRVARMFRLELLFAALVWIAMALVELLGDVQMLGLWAEGLASIPQMKVKELPMNWPSRHFQAQALACQNGWAFAANLYQVFEMNYTSGAMVEYPCKINTTIQDLTIYCESSFLCKPLALTADGKITDCLSGAVINTTQLGDQKFLALKVDRQEGFAGLQNSTLMTSGEGRLVESVYDDSVGGWAPLWRLGSVHKINEMTAGTQCGEEGRRLQAVADPAAARHRAAAAQSRRLRPISHTTSHSRARAHFSGTSGRVAATMIGIRASRPTILQAEEGESLVKGVTNTLKNMAYTDEGLWLFRTAKTTRGWVDKNLVTLAEVPSLNVLRQWHLDQFQELLAGCQLGQHQVLLLQGRSPTKVFLGSVDPALYS